MTSLQKCSERLLFPATTVEFSCATKQMLHFKILGPYIKVYHNTVADQKVLGLPVV